MRGYEWYRAGLPCWVDAFRPDPEGAVGFYAEMFGWEAEDRTPSDSSGKYLVCRLRGRDVAAVGSRPSEDVPLDCS